MNVRDQKGNVLLYAVLTIAAIFSTTLVVSRIVQSSIIQTRYINNSQAAYYAAESGAEKALYEIRKNNNLLQEGSCEIGLQCDLEYSDEDIRELKLDLAENESVQLDLFNPNDNTDAYGLESMGLRWIGSGWLEVSYVSWDPLSSFRWRNYSPGMDISDLPVQKMLYSDNRVAINSFSSNKNYRVRIKALYQDAKDLTLSMHPSDNLTSRAMAVPNYLNWKFTGSFQESNQILTIAMPRYSPTVGLYDYVLFSEEIIQK
jgi:hypothetical protein